MKSKFLSLGLLSLAAVSSSFFVPATTPKAMALGCVAADVSVQVSVRGDRKPSQQRNNVNQEIQPGCRGNSVTTVGRQTHVGPGRVNQNRNSNQFLGGSGRGSTAGDVKVRVNPKIDVYSPALDPNYLNRKTGNRR